MKEFDDSFLDENNRLVSGCDEAGRGPLAGPVVAAAVLFNKGDFIEGVNDSKKLSEKKREYLFGLIVNGALSYSIKVISNKVIDDINILQASLLGMKQASEELRPRPDLMLIDGNKAFQSEVRTLPIIKGDSKSFAIAAASVLAKVTRDHIMAELDKEFPMYNWKKNKAYGTREHIEALKKYGPCPYHRRAFIKHFV